MEFSRRIAEMIGLAETRLPPDITRALEEARRKERNQTAKIQLDCMLKNLSLAAEKKVPICQDTGVLSFFVRPASLAEKVVGEIEKGVELASREIPLRPNTLDPLTGEEKPWFSLHLERGGEELEIDLLVKGGGSENWSRLFLLKPGDREGIVEAVLSTLREAGGKPCPPVVVGLGIGGTAEEACLLSRKALLRPLGPPDPFEREIMEKANKLGIGPMGLGGRTTVLGVRILKAPCHRATLPVALSLQCWVARRASLRMKGGKVRVFQ
jgi:tartrate/fumarate subfamily iron-sulfur-dependent hydro-lyase alpha chain